MPQIGLGRTMLALVPLLRLKDVAGGIESCKGKAGEFFGLGARVPRRLGP